MGTLELTRLALTPPRLALSSTRGPAGLAALRVYRPLRHRSRTGLASSIWLQSAGLARRTHRHDGLLPVITAARGLNPDDGIAVMRSSAPRRVVVGIGTADDGLHTVLKVGARTDAGLRREADMLNRLASSALHMFVPQLLECALDPDHVLLATAAVAYRDGATSYWDVAHLCAKMNMAGVCHGDLTPWNVLEGEQRPLIVDWESGAALRDDDETFEDFARYVVRDYLFLNATTAEACHHLLVGSEGPGAWLLRELGMPRSAAVASLRRKFSSEHHAGHRIGRLIRLLT